MVAGEGEERIGLMIEKNERPIFIVDDCGIDEKHMNLFDWLRRRRAKTCKDTIVGDR